MFDPDGRIGKGSAVSRYNNRKGTYETYGELVNPTTFTGDYVFGWEYECVMECRLPDDKPLMCDKDYGKVVERQEGPVMTPPGSNVCQCVEWRSVPGSFGPKYFK